VQDVHVTGSSVAYPSPREALAAIEARRGGASGAAAAAAAAAAVKTEPKQEGADQPQQHHGACDDNAQQQEGVKHEREEGEEEEGGTEAAAEPPTCSTGCSSATCESCYVTVRFLGYHRVAYGTGEILDTVELFLPDSQFETQVGGGSHSMGLTGVWEAASCSGCRLKSFFSPPLKEWSPLHHTCAPNRQATCASRYLHAVRVLTQVLIFVRLFTLPPTRS